MTLTALSEVTVIDLSANAPGPFASMMLADLGAEVTVITNPSGAPDYAGAQEDPMLAGRGGAHDMLARGKAILPLDLKSDAGRDALLERVTSADVLISEMRPGKIEALGLGWDVLKEQNPSLILCEITGYGRDDPFAVRAGHDLNYLARAGVQSLIRDRSGSPVVPQNLMGDYAAGGSFAVSAILAALLERVRTGEGQRLTVSMLDGVKYLASDIVAATLRGGHPEDSWRATLNGGMPTYDCYRTADDKWISVGALEPKFIAKLAQGLDWPELVDLMARKETWPTARQGLIDRFGAASRDEWEARFATLDACLAPVLSVDEAGQSGWPDFARVIGREQHRVRTTKAP